MKKKNRNFPHLQMFDFVVLILVSVIVCKNGLYGENCASRCECVHGICNPNNGQCVCNTGWSGDKCDTGLYHIIIIIYNF